MIPYDSINEIGKEVYYLMTGQLDLAHYNGPLQYAVKDVLTSENGELYKYVEQLYEARNVVQNIINELSNHDAAYDDLKELNDIMVCNDILEEELCIRAFTFGYMFAKGMLQKEVSPHHKWLAKQKDKECSC